ncbi:MAG: glycosyltransferase family 4 protein [Candidatus Bathyarchaeia archaeon]
MGKKLKVLISAYACEPGKGSEPGVGWNWVKQISRVHEVWVITRSNNKITIESCSKEALKNVHFIYIDLPIWLQRLKKLGGIFTLYLYYYLWQLRVYFVARSLHKIVKFDVAHHITFTGDWLPSFISLLGIPFIWGPVGGSTHRLPWKFLRRYTLRHCFYELCRCLFQIYGRMIDPFVVLTRKRSWKIIAYTEEAKLALPPSAREKAIVIKHIGIDPSIIENFRGEKCRSKERQQFTIYTTGRLVHWKGYDLLIEAFAKFLREYKNAKLLIGGKGPMESWLRYLVKNLGLEKYVQFLGYLSYDSVLKQIAEADVFCLLTLRDGPPVVLLEAMAIGTPVICLDLYGAGQLVPDEAGVKIKAINPQQVIEDVTKALLKLANDPIWRSTLSKYAVEYTLRAHRWDHIGDQILQLYDELSGKSTR